MATKSIAWNTGSGNINVEYGGSKDGTIVVTSDNNNLYESRSQQIKVRTTDGSNIERTITIQQAAKVRIDISTAIVTAANQTYSGSAKTPAPTVTLNGETIPSSDYDVAYSDNTNAGTATITVTGKGDYTGTATGSFTIAKANSPITTEPVAKTGLVYNGTAQQLCTNGVASIAGTWNYPTSISAASTVQGTAYFIPNDTTNYNQYSKLITTSIAKASRTLSFADSYVVLNTSSNVTKTATPSAGSGDGSITYSISSTTYATINSSSGKVTSKTSDGSAVVTATIAEGTNYLSATASYNLYVFATTHNYDYNGSYRSVTLPPGTYQFQCWGAQGGSNGTYSSYGITSKAGGKGGYSVGQLTISQATGIRVYVGGQGSSSSGGFNGGGGTTGTAEYTRETNRYGYSKMGGGGGATDIRLSDGSLYSRMIVAGGGSGGAMGYVKETSTETVTTETIPSSALTSDGGYWSESSMIWSTNERNHMHDIDVSSHRGETCTIKKGSKIIYYTFLQNTSHYQGARVSYATGYSSTSVSSNTDVVVTVPANANTLSVWVYYAGDGYYDIQSVVFTKEEQVEHTYTDSQIGYAGGGVNGVGYSSSYYGTQTSAGVEGSFGNGGTQASAISLYCAGAGGGGWYGGGTEWGQAYSSYINRSGGGSGFVNTAASASNRPSGYTGLQLDSGETKAGNTSFPSTGGSTETGHAGNGYARITRIN